MFPRNKIDILYRLMCLIAFLLVIIFVNSLMTLFIITLAFYILTLFEKRFENIFLYIVTGIIVVVCLTLNSYFLLRIIMVIDYIHYFMNNVPLDDDEEEEEIDFKRDQHYIRFKNEKEGLIVKDNNNGLCTLFVMVHLGLLIIAIVVG